MVASRPKRKEYGFRQTQEKRIWLQIDQREKNLCRRKNGKTAKKLRVVKNKLLVFLITLTQSYSNCPTGLKFAPFF